MSDHRFIRALVGWSPVVALGLGIGVFLRHEIAPASSAATAPPPRVVENWRAYATGAWLAPGPAPVTIVEFSDFECPFCKKFHAASRALAAELPGQVAIAFRHYPLEGLHPEALRTAVAAECARRRGRFAQFADEAFLAQDSLRAIGPVGIAARAGVTDTAEFRVCLASKSAREAVARDVKAGNALHVFATPTVLVNDRLFARSVSAHDLDSLVRALLARGQ